MPLRGEVKVNVRNTPICRKESRALGAERMAKEAFPGEGVLELVREKPGP